MICPEPLGTALIQIAPAPPLSPSENGLSPTMMPGPLISNATHWILVVMDQFTRTIVGFGLQAGPLDGVALCRMFNPSHVSTVALR
jgi:hypothetical protein